MAAAWSASSAAMGGSKATQGACPNQPWLRTPCRRAGEADYRRAFTRADGTGHMVVVHYDPVDQQCSHLDYQVDDAGAGGSGDVSPGTALFLYGT
jgi:hypothetical protein